MMYGVKLYMRVRRSCMVDGVSIRSMAPVHGQISESFGGLAPAVFAPASAPWLDRRRKSSVVHSRK